MNVKDSAKKTRWHRLLGKLLEELLTPVGVSVYTDFPVMSNPPEADILLLKKNRANWTDDQLERLPDGVRDSKAEHILIEFKYSESVNDKAVQQTLGYDIFYRRSQQLAKSKVQTFLISARTPGRLVLERFGYILSKPGVYYSDNYLLAQIPLISLNELSNSPHNAFIRCFASKKREKHVAFNILRKQGLESFQKQVQWLIAGLWESWFIIGGSEMDKELTPEKVIEMGKMWGKMYLSSLSPEERLAGLEPKDRLAGLSKKELQRIYKKLREDIEN